MDDSVLLQYLPAWSLGFVLVLSRVGSACMLLPGIGEAELPTTVRAGLAVALTLLLLPLVVPEFQLSATTNLELLLMVLAEVATGLWIGWLARLIVLALPMAAQTIAGMIGLSNVLQPDIVLGPQSSALARLFALVAPIAILATGLHALPLMALAGSYRLIPAGAMISSDNLAQSIIAAVSQSFGLSVQLAAPFIAASIVWNVSLGLLTRLVPQLQIYFAAMPGQILGGFCLIGLLCGAIIATWLGHVDSTFALLPGL